MIEMEENDLKCEPVVASVVVADVPTDVAVGDMDVVATEDAYEVGGNSGNDELEE